MSSKGIKIAAWISVAVNLIAVGVLMNTPVVDGAWYGIVYAIGMIAVSVVALRGANEWDKQSRGD